MIKSAYSYRNQGYHFGESNFTSNLDDLRNKISENYKNNSNIGKDVTYLRFNQLSNSDLIYNLIKLITSQQILDFFSQLSSLTNTDVRILPPFSIMKDYHSNRQLSNGLGWHRDCGTEIYDNRCLKNLKNKNYVFGKIGIYLQENNDFGGAIDLIPRSHKFLNKNNFYRKISNLPIWICQKLHRLSKKTYSKIDEKIYLNFIKGISVQTKPLTPVFFDSRIYHRGTPISDKKIHMIEKISDFHYKIPEQKSKIAIYAQFGNSIGAESYLIDRNKRNNNQNEIDLWNEHIKLIKLSNINEYKKSNEIFNSVLQDIKIN